MVLESLHAAFIFGLLLRKAVRNGLRAFRAFHRCSEPLRSKVTLKFFCKDRRLLLYMSRTLHLFGTDWCAMMVPIQVIRWYRMQCYNGTDSCAIVVPNRRYCHNICNVSLSDDSSKFFVIEFNDRVRIVKCCCEPSVPWNYSLVSLNHNAKVPSSCAGYMHRKIFPYKMGKK